MSEGIKVVAMTCLTFVLLGAMTTGYNLYTEHKRREVYLECLKSNERVLELRPNAFTSSCYLR